MANDDENTQGSLPANRSSGAPERRGRNPGASPVRRNDRGTPMPEFLSLTYTLPHHLIVQVEDLAEETNRSPSEVLAEAFRLYLQVRQGVERRARISTVNGFAYQEVELAEAVLDEEAVARLHEPHGPPPHDEAGPTPQPGAPARADSARADAREGPGAAETPPPAPARQHDEATPAAEATAGAVREGDDSPSDPDRDTTPSGDPESLREDPAAGVDPGDGTSAEDAVEVESIDDEAPPAEPDAPEGDEADGDAGSTVETVAGQQDDAAETPEATAHDESETPASRGEAEGSSVADLDAGWEALANVGDRGQDGSDGVSAAEPAGSTVDEETGPSATPEESGRLQIGPEGPSPDEDAAEEIRGRLLPLAGEARDSDRLRRVLEAIMREVDRKDYSPPDHSRKVAGLCHRLGKLKGLDGDELLTVELAGLLHDIGKACVPDELIRHIRLTKDEMTFVRRYPEMGAELLSTVPALEPVAALVRSHQERWDGSGYPEGLEGSQIATGAQIVAVCDIYDTLITERRYRPAYTEERAVQIIRENVGRLWNPDIATPFVKKIVSDS